MKKLLIVPLLFLAYSCAEKRGDSGLTGKIDSLQREVDSLDSIRNRTNNIKKLIDAGSRPKYAELMYDEKMTVEQVQKLQDSINTLIERYDLFREHAEAVVDGMITIQEAKRKSDSVMDAGRKELEKPVRK